MSELCQECNMLLVSKCVDTTNIDNIPIDMDTYTFEQNPFISKCAVQRIPCLLGDVSSNETDLAWLHLHSYIGYY
jgi:hypothetical protein